ncbi:MAG: MCE family protein [Deltaproteobacteria bacterium]|nr:MCE family protein [Deltaproteobacteria bacterium]
MYRSKELMQIQVGAFVAIGLLLAMMVIFLLGSEKRLFETHYTLVCFFDDISGLREGATVQLAGIHVGTVREILFEEKIEKKKVKLVLKLSKRYQSRIRADSKATIMTQGLLGDKMVFVSVGSAEAKILKDGDILPSESPTGFAEVLQRGDVLLQNVNDIAEDLKEIVKEVREGKGTIHGLVYDPHGEELVSDIKMVAENLAEASRHAAGITGKINRGEGTLGALVNDASLYNDMKTLLGKANRNKLIQTVVRYTLKTRDEKLLKTDSK